MNRGDVWWARFPTYSPRPHPVILLSWDSSFNFRNQITVAQVTSTVRNLDAEVHLGKEDGLPNACVANLDAIAMIHRKLLVEKICTLNVSRMREIEKAIHIALGIHLPCDIE